MEASYFHCILSILVGQSKLKGDNVGVDEDGLSAEVAFIQNFNDLEERVHAFVETASTFIELSSIFGWS